MFMKHLAALQKNLIYSIPVAMVVGFFFGRAFDPSLLKQLIIPLTFLMVYPMMVNLQLKKVFEGSMQPVQVVSQIINFTVIPGVGYLLGQAFFKESSQYAYALGLLLICMLPTSGMTISWTGMARGNKESAVKMTVFGLLIGAVAAPFYVEFLMGTVIDVPMLKIFRQIMIVILIPLILGNLTQRFMIKRYGLARYQKDLKKLFPPFSTLGVIGIIFVAIALKAESIAQNPREVLMLLPVIIIMYIINYALSTIIGKIWFKRGDAIALIYGTVMRNLSVALAIAITAFPEEGPKMSLIIALAYLIQVQSAAWYVNAVNAFFGPAPEATVKDVMIEGVFALHRNDTLSLAVRLLAEEHIHSFVVLDEDDKPAGMVTTAIVIDALADHTSFDTLLSDLQLEPVLIESARTPLPAALENMKRKHEYKALILDDRGNISHVLTQDEILQHINGVC